jgi:acyl-CoA-binding protein
MDETVTDPVALNLLFHQAVNDVVKGLIPFSLEESTKLAALHLQYVHGDSNAKKQIITKYHNYSLDNVYLLPISETLSRFIPVKILAMRQPEDWVRLLLVSHASLKGMSIEQAKTEYYDKVKHHPFYSSTMFVCEVFLPKLTCYSSFLATKTPLYSLVIVRYKRYQNYRTILCRCD